MRPFHKRPKRRSRRRRVGRPAGPTGPGRPWQSGPRNRWLHPEPRRPAAKPGGMSNPGRPSQSRPPKGGLRPERRVPKLPIQGVKRVVHPLVAFGLIVLVSGVFATVSGRNAGTRMAIPDAFVGIWKTTARNYEGRFFQISKDAVVFSIGDGQTDMHPIMNVEFLREGSRSLYTIS